MDKALRDNLLTWLKDKSERDSMFLGKQYIPALERLEDKGELELHQACRTNDLAKINYVQGKLDGVQEVIGLINGMRITESKNRAVPTLMERILEKFGEHNAGGNKGR